MKQVLNIYYPILAIFYLVSLSFLPYPAAPLVKALPIILLAVIVLIQFKNDVTIRIFGIGLVFSFLGDIVLALTIENSFVIGLGLFLIAHLFYIYSFYKSARVEPMSRRTWIALIIFFAIFMALLILPKAGGLAIPVGIYLSVIAIMSGFAALQKENGGLFFIAAFIFMISDGLIAWNKFIQPITNSGLLIMTTYYIAQGLLTRAKTSIK
jgi:alkenylglycerophosphocholine hydrolase